MRFEIITLFPEVVDHLRVGLLAKALDGAAVEVEALNPREFTHNKHRSVDDAPYGGGSGMVLSPVPMGAAIQHLDAKRNGPSHKVLLTPQGARFDQAMAERFASLDALTLICGRYEGFDERIRGMVDEEVSLGDFVLLGGESAATTIIEATARLLPGVLGNAHSAVEESHSTGLLEHPQYTRPANYEGQEVPPVLLSGNHALIARWRRKEALRRTLERRPDMLARALLTDEDRALLLEVEEESQA